MMIDQSDSDGGAPIRVLVVEDAPEYASVINAALSKKIYRVHIVDTGEQALDALTSFDPDVVLLDLILPGIDGVEVCKRIRSQTDVYVIMLTARSDEADKLAGLSVGADDYLTKPFSPRELVARLEAIMRRPRSKGLKGRDTEDRSFGHLTIRPVSRETLWDEEVLGLTRIEFNLLEQITASPGQIHSKRSLIDSVWGTDWVGDDHVVDVHMANLRKKIDRCGVKNLTTVRGVGYRLAVEQSPPG